jgi:hypothetical protein
VSTIEELLERESSGSCPDNRDCGCIASVNKVVYQLITKISFVVVVIEPTYIHSIANSNNNKHPTTPTCLVKIDTITTI